MLQGQHFARAVLGIGCLITVGACQDFPRDPQQTETLVRTTGVVRLGWVEGAEADEAGLAALRQISTRTGARIERHHGDSERLLRDLADGKLDLVFGHFAKSSPWAKEVHFGSALGWRAPPPKRDKVPRFAMRNGENGWVMLVEASSQP